MHTYIYKKMIAAIESLAVDRLTYARTLYEQKAFDKYYIKGGRIAQRKSASLRTKRFVVQASVTTPYCGVNSSLTSKSCCSYYHHATEVC